MKGWMRKLGLGALALSLGVAVGGCDNGGGSGLIRIFFGIVGDGDCGRVVLTVNLDDAGATIETDESGAANCDLASALALSGCIADFDLDGGVLTATIDSCTINEISALFSCAFKSGVNIDALDAATTAICECAGDDCDENPPVCVDRDLDPLSCEDCDNDIDDDGDGLTDCEDPVCANVPPCNFTSTTLQTTTTVSNTTTTLPPTTTTLPPTTTTSVAPTTTVTLPPAFECKIIFAVEDEASYGSLQFDVAYADAPGGFAGSDGDVECAGLAGDIPQFNDKENQQILTAGTISVSGFDGPADVAECTFNGTIPPVADDFAIEVTDATNPDLDAIVPTPVVFVSDISCTSGESTTTLVNETTTTTSTTEGNVTTTLGPTTTTTTGGGGTSEIVFSVSNTATFGALQFGADYASAVGNFLTDGADVDCTDSIGGAVVPVFNDITAERTLNIGYIAVFGFASPTEIARCRFNGTPAPGDFVITVDDASDANLEPIHPDTVNITVSVVPAS